MKSRALLSFLLLVSAAAAQLTRVSAPSIELAPPNPLSNFGKFDAAPDSGSSVVSVADLAVPARARKQFDKSNELLRKQRLDDALHELNKAVRIYPHFAGAYNNMGVIYARLGDTGLRALVAADRHRSERSLRTGLRELGAYGSGQRGLQRCRHCPAQGVQTGRERCCTLRAARLFGARPGTLAGGRNAQPESARGGWIPCLCA